MFDSSVYNPSNEMKVEINPGLANYKSIVFIWSHPSSEDTF